jgi:D-glycero-alpha-D-manno-heptose-7-phosphate kinase
MRISFAGGGTDLPPFTHVGGRVVGTALDLRVHVLVEPFDRGWVRLESSIADRELTRPRGEPARDDTCFRLLEAALASAGIDEGARVLVRTDVVPGAGLGGSAAAAVATLAALRASLGETLDAEALAQVASRMEKDALGILCGSQDQTFAAFGGLLDLVFDDRGCRSHTPIETTPSFVATFEDGLLLVDTLLRRVSGDILRRQDASAARRTTAELVAAANDVAHGFAECSLERVLSGMRRSAIAKLQRDPMGNALALDVTSRVQGLGAEVIRVCGAGGGGHVLVWAPAHRHDAIIAAVAPWRVRKPRIAAQGVRLETI